MRAGISAKEAHGKNLLKKLYLTEVDI